MCTEQFAVCDIERRLRCVGRNESGRGPGFCVHEYLPT